MNWTNLRGRVWRTPFARAALVVAVGVLSAGFIWIGWSAHQGRIRVAANVALLRQQASIMASQAEEISRLRQVKPNAPTAGDARADLLAAAQSTGIAATLVRIDVLGADRAQVIFGTVPFAEWLAWSATLEGRGYWIESCRVESAAEPGRVGITAVLARSAR